MKIPFMTKTEFKYRVGVWLPSVDTLQFQTSLNCNIKRDKNDGLLYLVNQDESFKELFPGENRKDFVKEDLDNYKAQLVKLKAQKKNINKDSTENYKNIDRKILELEFIVDKYNEEAGTFVLLGEKGKKTIHYVRRTTGLHPLKFNPNSNNVFLPKESDSRDAFLSWKSKYEALKDKNQDFAKKVMMVVGIIFGTLLLFGTMWFLYKLMTHQAELDQAKIEAKYICQDIYDSGIAEIIADNTQTAENLRNVSEEMVNMPGIGKNDVISDITSGIKVGTEVLK
ncbi:MAG: hypothetical protein R6V14_01530 [Halanaerobiales bacterium]